MGADDDGAPARATAAPEAHRGGALSHARDAGAGNSGYAAFFAAICALIVRGGVVAILLRWFDLAAVRVDPDF
jgi:hypothetical protein